jgi:hypothetical protein
MGKTKYPDETTAVAAAISLRKKTGDLITAYKCSFGKHYHVGHPSGRMQPTK